VKLLTQPGDGVNPLVEAIIGAKVSVDIAIFRFDRKEVEHAMVNAVSRGVHVRALIAFTNRGGEKRLRDLEARLLKAGVTVARTSDDLVRYHAKYVIIDRQELFLLAFNFTYLDIDQSRSFGIITRNKKVVDEASRLFEMDVKRQPYTAALDWLIVSPANAREALAEFIKGAKTQLYIYDPCISDPAMIRALVERKKSGIEVKILGRLTRGSTTIEVAKLHEMRLHTRMILRDGRHAFVGSQSLRTIELDRRREVGIVFEDAAITGSIAKTFLNDWKKAEEARLKKAETDTPTAQMAKKVAKAVVKDLPDMMPLVETTLEEMGSNGVEMVLNAEELQDSVRDAVKHAVKSAVKDAAAAEAAPAEQ
jgi:cardiolipin synthase